MTLKPGISDNKSRVSDDAVAGGCAGATARMLTAPFDVLKIRFQLQSQNDPKYKTILQSFRRVITDEGILALWKGNLSASYLWVSYMTVQFSMYGVLKRFGEQIPNPFLSNASGSTQLDTPVHQSSRASADARSDQAWHALVLFFAGAGAGRSLYCSRAIKFALTRCCPLLLHRNNVCSSYISLRHHEDTIRIAREGSSI